MIKRIKNTVPWSCVIGHLKGEVGTFYEKELEKQIKKSLELKNSLKEKTINYMSNGKATIIFLIVGLIKKTCYK